MRFLVFFLFSSALAFSADKTDIQDKADHYQRVLTVASARTGIELMAMQPFYNILFSDALKGDSLKKNITQKIFNPKESKHSYGLIFKQLYANTSGRFVQNFSSSLLQVGVIATMLQSDHPHKHELVSGGMALYSMLGTINDGYQIQKLSHLKNNIHFTWSEYLKHYTLKQKFAGISVNGTYSFVSWYLYLKLSHFILKPQPPIEKQKEYINFMGISVLTTLGEIALQIPTLTFRTILQENCKKSLTYRDVYCVIKERGGIKNMYRRNMGTMSAITFLSISLDLLIMKYLHDKTPTACSLSV